MRKTTISQEHHDRISRQSLYEDGIQKDTFLGGFNSFHQEKSALFRHLAFMLHICIIFALRRWNPKETQFFGDLTAFNKKNPHFIYILPLCFIYLLFSLYEDGIRKETQFFGDLSAAIKKKPHFIDILPICFVCIIFYQKDSL